MSKLTQRDVFFIMVGLCLGLLAAYAFAIGFISAFDGMFQNVNVTVALNETKLVDAAIAYQESKV